MRIPIVVFAQVPPPEHGQSRMVLLALETLRRRSDAFDVRHVNARFSNSLEEIGESSIGKMVLTVKYLAEAIRERFRIKEPLLYYVPGPVKWSAVLRDWVLLAVLRVFYPKIIFHWHAIGQGEWANGSDRLALQGAGWVDRLARKISAWTLHEPFASIAVSPNSQNDTLAVATRRKLVVCNGIEDPCPDFKTRIAPLRLARQETLASATRPCFKILFLSHGTAEKGIIDALGCMTAALERSDPAWSFDVTFAGGVSESIRTKFDEEASALLTRWPDRIRLRESGYLTGEDKHRCFIGHDVFLAPSRWESFGLTVIEAMAYGMPIVAAASDGVQGVLPENHPYLAPVTNPLALAEKLLACGSALRESTSPDEGNELRDRFLALYQIKGFSENLVRAFLDLGGEAADPAGEPVVQLPAARCFGESVMVREERKNQCGATDPFAPTETPEHRNTEAPAVRSSPTETPNHRITETPTIRISVYLADQNPGHDRSFGISRMSHVVMEALQERGCVSIEAITSKTSQQPPASVGQARMLPWGTRRKWVRLMTDHFHPLFQRSASRPDLHYFPKGYLPLTSIYCHPSVVTIHDTIIQYDEDHYPKWRSRWEYAYWAKMLKHTLRQADEILTVSESSKRQIEVFMERHLIPMKDITVTYEPCAYEQLPQPVNPAKENYVIHLASVEPHKRTAHLIRWWHEAEEAGRILPMLHLIGTVPEEVAPLLASSRSIMKRPFLEDSALQSAYQAARALILPSEIEGFGLPALEAYYLGTPVCFVKGTSVEEILNVTTDKGGFSLDDEQSLFAALNDVMAMSPEEVRECGLSLRKTYAAEIVAERILQVFQEVKNR